MITMGMVSACMAAPSLARRVTVKEEFCFRPYGITATMNACVGMVAALLGTVLVNFPS